MIRNTRYTVVGFAVAALFVLGTGGVTAATVAETPLAVSTSGTPSEVASPDNYTVDVMDPDDELDDQDVEDARHVAWANETVRSYFDENESVHFDVWASPGDDGNASVWVATNESAPTRVVVDVDLEASSVTDIEEPEVRTADEVVRLDLDGNTFETVENGSTEIEFEVVDAEDDGDANVTVVTADESAEEA